MSKTITIEIRRTLSKEEKLGLQSRLGEACKGYDTDIFHQYTNEKGELCRTWLFQSSSGAQRGD